MKNFDELNGLELDTLREIGSIGTGNAATALSSMLGCEVRIDLPEVRVMGYNEAIDWIGGPEVITAGVLVRLGGEINGIMLSVQQMEFVDLVLHRMMGQSVSSYDHLSAYAFLLLLVQLTVRLIYTWYSRVHFPEVRARLREGRGLLREILSYSSWCTLGYLSVVGYTQGLNILLNLFFGPAVNAARGVAVQVQSAVSQLCSNFQTALNPQITKSYASDNLPYMHQLVVYSSKYSCFLMMLVVLPIILNAKYILHLWLGVVPDHTVAFVRLTLVIALMECLKNPLLASIHATGNIRKLQTVEGLMLLSIVPIAYVLLKLGVGEPEWVFGVYLIVEAVTQAARVWIILPRIGMPFVRYVHDALYPVCFVAVCLLPIPLCYEPEAGIVSLIWTTLACVLLTSCLIWVLGLRGDERHFIKEKLELWKLLIKSKKR